MSLAALINAPASRLTRSLDTSTLESLPDAANRSVALVPGWTAVPSFSVRLSVGVWVMTMSTFLIEWGQEGLLHPTRAAGPVVGPCAAPRDVGLNRRPADKDATNINW